MGCSWFWFVSPSFRWIPTPAKDASVSVDVNLFASAVLSGGDSVMVGDRGKVFLSEGWAGTWKEIESGTTRRSGDRLLPE